jgi:hypothetical protein
VRLGVTTFIIVVARGCFPIDQDTYTGYIEDIKQKWKELANERVCFVRAQKGTAVLYFPRQSQQV